LEFETIFGKHSLNWSHYLASYTLSNCKSSPLFARKEYLSQRCYSK